MTRRKYRLEQLRNLDLLVAEMVGVDIPFNNYITGYSAFTHKAGIHAKAILNAPETYEALDPHDFGLTRYISIAHRLTGWNAVKARADQLGLALTDDQIKALTQHIKALADERMLTLDDVDDLLKLWANGQTIPSFGLPVDGVEGGHAAIRTSSSLVSHPVHEACARRQRWDSPLPKRRWPGPPGCRRP